MSTTTGDPSPSLSLARDYHVMDTSFNNQVAATREALRMFQAVIPLKETATIKIVLEELVNTVVSCSFLYLWRLNHIYGRFFRLDFTTSPRFMFQLPCIASSLLPFFQPSTIISRKTPTSSIRATIHGSCVWSLS